MQQNFESPELVQTALNSADYLATDEIATALYLAQKLGKPLLVEGPAGTGKTQLAKSVAEISSAELVRLQCYEGLDESRALYEWDYQKQLLRIQSIKETQNQDWSSVEEDIFSESFLLERPLLKAIRNSDPTVLLVDEVDRLEVEAEALLLEVLSEYQVSIPELGTVVAQLQPLVILTSNNTRELSEALKRRCLFLYLGYPSVEREHEIVLAKLPNIESSLALKLVEVVALVREMDLKKAPSVSETIDWAEALVALGIRKIDSEVTKAGLPILLKYVEDIALVNRKLKDSDFDD